MGCDVCGEQFHEGPWYVDLAFRTVFRGPDLDLGCGNALHLPGDGDGRVEEVHISDLKRSHLAQADLL